MKKRLGSSDNDGRGGFDQKPSGAAAHAATVDSAWGACGKRLMV
jgi:hypothetical protein